VEIEWQFKDARELDIVKKKNSLKINRIASAQLGPLFLSSFLL